ncbi:MAG: PAS domain S-box protein [Lentisphaerae bacterium]|nr:PAS domain S-box protein [Lentisphaerota bacterium]MBT4816320.1 PAS domain S-box protein [Lentisphaerota bacterium]MBT5607478.1 PAS domain S-box protein [Lentisphaerota bacterium]MBT7055758.1 PAS domain S-box protein [Lentisphaerota bacterium]MBT7843107.1 PAS domain S-box protein [Lentisphaerota bacterium]
MSTMSEARKLRQLYHSVLNTVSDGIWVTNANDQITFLNRSMEQIAGVSSENVSGLCVLTDFPEETTGQFLPHYLQARETLESVTYEAPVVTPAGRHTVQAGSLTPRVLDGQFAGMICTVQDLTELRGTERELLEAATRAGRFLDIAPAIILALDCDGNVTLLNQEGARILECDPSAAIGLNWFDTFLPEANQDEVRRVFAQLMAGKLENVEDYENDVVAQRSGSCRLIHWHNTLLRDDDGRITGLLSSGEDITDRRHAEEERERLQTQLTQAQKLESVGRLAGGVAHDFNNLLTGIMGYVELCREHLTPNHPIRGWLEEITQDAQRSAGITRQLLTFARKQTIAPQLLGLNDAVSSVLGMLRRLIGEDIDLTWRPASDLWPVNMDPSQLDQVLTNLAINARDAIGGVGKLTIETENATVDSDYCRIHSEAEPGAFAVLAVSDDGCGMGRQTLEHVFEPFFTTKEAAEGTGLGLATVYGVVKQNDGFINVYSEPGKGTTFRIYLPRHQGEAVEMREPDAPPPLPGGDETILIVEDEKSIRVTTRLFLEDLGYTVLVSATPEEAIGLITQHPDDVQLLITDVVMPGMNGRDLAETLNADRPDMKVLYISGYTAEVIAHHGILDDGVDFLPKPFTHGQFVGKVREVLDR